MTSERWSEVDDYLNQKLIHTDAILESALRASEKACLPNYAVTPTQGKFLYLLARLHRAARILEIGTLGGYSTIWLARAVSKGGSIISLESNAAFAEVAKANIENAGLSEIVEIRVGLAIDTLKQLETERVAPFDLIFIDADKVSNPIYLEWSLKLSRPGTVIICDNVVRNGAVVELASTDPSVIGTRKFFDLVAQNPRLSATVIQTVGEKGYDGFCLAIFE